jgi:hypothetical protein
MDGPGIPMPPTDAPSPGTLITHPVAFSGRYLFVNAKMNIGELRVEILELDGRVVEPFTLANCVPLSRDGTKHAVVWKDTGDLGKLSGKPLRFRFQLTAGELYSFWVSPDSRGASHGYVAAGWPGFTGSTDTTGV